VCATKVVVLKQRRVPTFMCTEEWRKDGSLRGPEQQFRSPHKSLPDRLELGGCRVAADVEMRDAHLATHINLQ